MSDQENPPVDETLESDTAAMDVDFGDSLYTEDGTEVGIVQGIDDTRVVVSVRNSVELFDLERHQRSGHGFGEAELMWRCTNCGEMGEIDDGLPDTCPNCGVEREELMYWTED